ncbi:hypothetical protein PBY51_006387 [Eleginops maclovinus]|uniref:Uncharacterized protein n=1 Tax=Eleginops maclovinus TaxID=56733 RepID=A0AAN7X1Z6_ELEMC|nr:hypothetical protein PBY51_006387 [Eleginops maclovinus]
MCCSTGLGGCAAVLASVDALQYWPQWMCCSTGLSGCAALLASVDVLQYWPRWMCCSIGLSGCAAVLASVDVLQYWPQWMCCITGLSRCAAVPASVDVLQVNRTNGPVSERGPRASLGLIREAVRGGVGSAEDPSPLKQHLLSLRYRG